jgi:hypothetical protein
MTDAPAYSAPYGENGKHEDDGGEPHEGRPTHTAPPLPHLLVASNLREIAARVKAGMGTTHDAARLESLAMALDNTYDAALALRQAWPSREEIRAKITAAGGLQPTAEEW